MASCETELVYRMQFLRSKITLGSFQRKEESLPAGFLLLKPQGLIMMNENWKEMELWKTEQGQTKYRSQHSVFYVSLTEKFRFASKVSPPLQPLSPGFSQPGCCLNPTGSVPRPELCKCRPARARAKNNQYIPNATSLSLRRQHFCMWEGEGGAAGREMVLVALQQQRYYPRWKGRLSPITTLRPGYTLEMQSVGTAGYSTESHIWAGGITVSSPPCIVSKYIQLSPTQFQSPQWLPASMYIACQRLKYLYRYL